MLRGGYEGVELTGGDGRLLAREDEIKTALADSPVQASTICGGQTNQFIHRDQANRETSVRELRAGTPPDRRGRGHRPASWSRCSTTIPRVLGLEPYATTEQLQRDLLVTMHAPPGAGGQPT